MSGGEADLVRVNSGKTVTFLRTYLLARVTGRMTNVRQKPKTVSDNDI